MPFLRLRLKSKDILVNAIYDAEGSLIGSKFGRTIVAEGKPVLDGNYYRLTIIQDKEERPIPTVLRVVLYESESYDEPAAMLSFIPVLDKVSKVTELEVSVFFPTKQFEKVSPLIVSELPRSIEFVTTLSFPVTQDNNVTLDFDKSSDLSVSSFIVTADIQANS